MKISGAEICIRALEEEGIGHVLGIPGTHNIELFDQLSSSKKIKTVLITNEQSAGFIGHGLAQASGQLAALNLVPSAGLSHALSGIAECYLDQVPLLVLASGVRRDIDKKYQLHQVDQLAMARPVCKGAYQAKTHLELYQLIKRAAREALRSPQGPVVVEIPANLFLFRAHLATADLQCVPERKLPLSISTHLLEQAEVALNKAENIALYVGQGARVAHKSLVDLANRLDVIVYTTISGKGVFPEDHPRFVWNTMGEASPKPMQSLEKKCDLVLAIGCRFSEVATASYGFKHLDNLIHVDVDPEVFNHNYQASLSICAEACTFVDALLGRDLLRPRHNHFARLDELKSAHQHVATQQAQGKSSKVTPSVLAKTLQKVATKDAIHVTDSGNGTFVAMEHLKLPGPRCFLAPVDYSCMGYAIPAAIGAKLACPERDVVVWAGDGAFTMTGMELATAVQQKLGMVICLLNDGKLSQIAQFQKKSLNREFSCDLPAFDYQAFAKAVGIDYLSLPNDQAAAKTLDEAFQSARAGRPVLVNVIIDYSVPTYFTRGALKTNFLRFSWKERLRLASRLVSRKLTDFA